MSNLPRFALSIRQPWAWAIIHAGKNIENRSWSARFAPLRAALAFRGPVCIHASKGMTRDEYFDACEAIASISGIEAPLPNLLMRGGIIGTAEIVDVVRKSHSPWFFGSVGLVLANQQPVDFIPCRGALGFFEWSRDPGTSAERPAKWMLPQDERSETRADIQSRQGSLL